MKSVIIILVGCLSAMLIFYFQPGEKVGAAEDIYCGETEIIRKDANATAYWKYSAAKTSPNFVLDYYQDPDLTGVDISVTIESEELIVNYSKREDVCLPVPEPYYGERSNCTPEGGADPAVVYRWQRQCVPQPPETTFRAIDTDTVWVWLDMSLETKSLLGPGPYYNGTESPVLRYLYPDQWAVRVARPGEMEIIEQPGFKNAEEVEAFLKENEDYLILESDAKSALSETRMKISFQSVLEWPALSLVERRKCVAGVNTTGLDADLTAKAGGEKICSFSTYYFSYGANKLEIEMKKIPLDLPGEWYIGVSFYMDCAVFDNGNGSEQCYGMQIFERSNEADEMKFAFKSYILRSSPCNPDEPGGCWEE
ncbi:MAG: hypothetical protein JW929_01430 [Anaerolineales bacterium]|nr:hypothetical protein [Anaerolineales bacterium]